MGFGAAFLDHLRRLAGSRRYRLMLLLFLGASALSVATYRQRVVRELPVAVLDMDGTGLSRTAVRWLDATPDLRVVGDAPPTLAAAQDALDRGALAGVVVIPDGFAAALKRGRRAEVLVAVDMSNVLVGRSASRAVARVLGTLSAGAQVTLLQKLGTAPSAALARAVPIAVTESLSRNPGASFAVYLAPAFAYFFLHLVTLFLAWSVLWPAAPGRPLPETLGRLGAALATSFALGLVTTYVLIPFDGVPIASPFPVVGGMLLAFLLTDLLFAVALAAPSGASLFSFQVTVLLAMLSLMLSGLTWPWDVIPVPLRAVAAAIPFTPFGRAFRLFLHERAALSELARPLAWLGAQAAASLAVIGAAALARRLPARLRRPA